MTSTAINRDTDQTPAPLDRRLYWAVSAPFLLIFVGSVVLTFADLEATRTATAGFGFPAWAVVPQGLAKAAGLVTIFATRWRLLTGLAFAGFFYDTLLALGAHLAQQDLPNILLASTGLLATAGAFWAHRLRYPPELAR